MKTKFLLPLCISVVMGAMVFISCEHEQNYSESIQNEEVNQFLQSSYGKDFLENFHFQIEDLNVEKLASLSQKNDVKLLCIPVTKNEKELGRLCVISNSQGRIFQALYEDWSDVNTEEGGMMKVFTTDHQYLATWTVTPEIDKFALKLTEVADVFDNGIDRVKTKTEFPAKTDSNCTAKCYAAAKEACDADPECKILCDLIDMATGCMASLSIATACAIYCNF